jgi:ATP-dependent 26S proteasome regulatory subunit
LNQLLTELDGFHTTEGVLVIGATNRFDLLDPAIVGGGRLSEHIEVPAPDLTARLQLLRLYSRKMPLETAVDLSALAEASEGLAGGDIESMCAHAAMHAFGRGARTVSPADFDHAIRNVLSNRITAPVAPWAR